MKNIEQKEANKMDSVNELMIKIIRSSNQIFFDGHMYDATNEFDLLHKFLNLTTEGRGSFIVIIRELKKLSSEKLLEKEKNLLEKFDQMTDYLINKCKDKSLKDGESKFLLMLISNALINNTEGLDEIISFYLNNYYFENKRYYIGEELVLLNQYVINFLNQLNNSQIETKYVSSLSSHASIRRKDNKTEFLINKDLYLSLIANEQLSEEEYYNFITYLIFIIMHEFYHSKQFDGFDNYKMNIEEIKEYLVAFNSYKFYSKYHDNFKFEQDADYFAINSTKAILKGITPPDILEESVENLGKSIEKIHSKDLDRIAFQELINNEYTKLSQETESPGRKNM